MAKSAPRLPPNSLQAVSRYMSESFGYHAEEDPPAGMTLSRPAPFTESSAVL